ncbi:unnamed protein product [Adineta steineri]|uniref:Uncharacterized protein n=1 Tax=Adineta steineri TaxID=433720 RepID=A0A815BMP7_9BILA|nr:unnamed protein product [Adineta steineri]CAF3786751.1 unnamed protein product [Adineta steineri]CAF3794255.1 unnamed protein product [Adineta steineri]
MSDKYTSIPIHRPRVRTTKTFLLVWLHNSTDTVNDNDYQNIITELQQVVGGVHRFTDVDELVDFITDVAEEPIYLILSKVFVQTMISVVHEIPQVECVYILNENNAQCEQWLNQWQKIKGIYSDIKSIGEALEKTSKIDNQNMIPISFIDQPDSNHNVYQVNLTLTNDTDPDLHTLSEHIRANSLPHKTGWYRLGNLLIQMGQFNQAQELFEVMLHQTSNELEKANIYHMLGMIKYELGDYINAIELYEKSIKINQKILPPTHPDLAASYRNLGMVYDKMAKHSIIHSVEENPIETIITSSDLPFSTSDSNSDLVSASMDDYSKAVLSFENALTVLQQTFPPDGLTLVTFYELYGTVYEKLGDYNKALSLHKRALEIKQKHLPSNHPSLATSYANHGTAYQQMGDIPTARSYFRRALDIGQRSLPSNHPDLRRFREMIGND